MTKASPTRALPANLHNNNHNNNNNNNISSAPKVNATPLSVPEFDVPNSRVPESGYFDFAGATTLIIGRE